MNVERTSRREIFQVKSSQDPVSGAVGVSAGYDLSAQAEKTVLHYRGRAGEYFLTADVYRLPGQPIYFLIFCPMCQNALRVSQDNKPMSYDPDVAPRFPGYLTEEVLSSIGAPSVGGVLSVEPFGCTWEADPALRRQHFAVCPWRVSIDRNLVRDA